MLAKNYLFSTLKENPKNTNSISHTLMLRAGLIRQHASGIYTWLPTGIRILNNVNKIIRQEMNKLNALEIKMPILQSENLWNLSNRNNIYGLELFKILDRKKSKFILGPTHEELITNFISHELKSYKQLPLLLYQIQTKFRDEIRPRCGVIRSREFIMKDGYSFHTNVESLQNTYDLIQDTYKNIFLKMNLKFHIVKADSGTIGGVKSHEFQALSENGEDIIALSNKSNYAANIQVATYKIESKNNSVLNTFKNNSLSKTSLYISKKCNLLNKNTIKTILIKFKKNKFLAILIRGDFTINETKLLNTNVISPPIKLASKEEILDITGTTHEFIGPIGLNIPVIADFSVISLENFTIGSNITGKFLNNVNWNKDLDIPKSFDIRNVVKNDISPDGKGKLKIKKSIEIAHIFQLGEKYSRIMKAEIRDQTGHKKFLKMGCYGIGITRTISSVIEQHNDTKGIIWPISIAPFQVAIIPINLYKSKKVQQESQMIYHKLRKNNIEVILNDKDECPGIMFSKMELIGIPYNIIISENLIKDGKVEYHDRSKNKREIVLKSIIISILVQKITSA